MTCSTTFTAGPRPDRASVTTMNWWLANSGTLERTLLIIKHMVDEFDLGNVSTAMYKLAVHAQSNPSTRRRIVRRREFTDLVAVVQARVEAFEPGHLSNTLRSLAKLDHHPGEPMLHRFVAAALCKVEDFKPKNACRMLWASAKLGHHPGEAALGRLCERISSSPDCLESRDLSDTLWSLAKLGHHPGEASLDRIAARVLTKLDDSSPRDLASVLWSLAKLGHSPGAEALDRISEAALSSPALLAPGNLSGMLWSLAVLATLGDTPKASVLRELGELLDRRRRRLAPVDACQVFHAHVLLNMGPNGSPLADKPELLDDARALWTADVAGSTQRRAPSALERTVEASLDRLGEKYRREQLTEDGCFSIDFGLVDAQMKLALEVDGPSHHLILPDGGRRPDGPTLVRNRCLEARGWRVVSVRDKELNRPEADIDTLIAAKLDAVRNARNDRKRVRRRSRFALRLRALLGTFGAAIRAGWKKSPAFIPDSQ